MPEQLPRAGPGAPEHPVPRKSVFGGSAGVVLATASSAGKQKAEQKGSNMDEWVLGELAARTATRVQADYGRLCAYQRVAKMRAASVSNTLTKSQEPIFHFVSTVFFLKAFFSACFLERLVYAVSQEASNKLSFNQFLLLSVLASHSFKALHLCLGIRVPCPFWEDVFKKN